MSLHWIFTWCTIFLTLPPSAHLPPPHVQIMRADTCRKKSWYFRSSYFQKGLRLIEQTHCKKSWRRMAPKVVPTHVPGEAPQGWCQYAPKPVSEFQPQPRCQKLSPKCQERHHRPGAAIQAPGSGAWWAVLSPGPNHTHRPVVRDPYYIFTDM